MAADINASLDKLSAALGKLSKALDPLLDAAAECRGPEHLFDRVIRSGDFERFKAFFDKYVPGRAWWSSFDLQAHEAMFAPEWMSRYEFVHMRWIYQLLVENDRDLKCTARIVADRRIAPERRAWCFHAVFAAYPRESPDGEIIPPHYWWYNWTAWQSCLDEAGPRDAIALFRCFGLANGGRKFNLPEGMWRSADDDSAARFEIERTLANRKICDSLLRFLIDRNAAKCFAFMLAHHGERVFDLRSPREWLLTVCRCADEELAVAAVDELERQFPGIVAAARDPWGNTALWVTLCDPRRKKRLQDELIRLGCDPDAENDLGLTFRLLRDNTPQTLRRPAGVPHP